MDSFGQGFHSSYSKLMPNLVRDIKVMEGDGGLGTVMLFTFGSDVSHMEYQKEKIVEFDEAAHQIGLQVTGGGHLCLGFSYYKTSFELTELGEKETLVDVKVAYETETEETPVPLQTTKAALAFLACLDHCLLNGSS